VCERDIAPRVINVVAAIRNVVARCRAQRNAEYGASLNWDSHNGHHGIRKHCGAGRKTLGRA